MTAETFERIYQPLTAPSGSDLWEADEVKAAGITAPHLWTVVDADGQLVVLAGLHVVNQIGYAVTTVPWETGDEEAPWA